MFYFDLSDMTKAKSATSLGISALIAIALILLIGFGVFLNDAFNSTSTITEQNPLVNLSTSVTGSYSMITNSTSSSSPSINSLKFSMSINSSTVLQGQDLSVTLSLFNTLDSKNNITGAQNWKLTNQSELDCQGSVFRIEVVQGYYSPDNYSGGTPLSVFPFVPPLGFNQCLFYIRTSALSDPALGQNYYIFNPKSDVAQWVTSGIYIPCSPNSCTRTANGTIVGECNPCGAINQTAVMNETANLKPYLFTHSTGVFTVIGGDEWGDLLIMTFIVQPSQNQTTATSNISSTTSNDAIITSGETCTPMNTGNQTSVTQTYLCHTESTMSSNSSS